MSAPKANLIAVDDVTLVCPIIAIYFLAGIWAVACSRGEDLPGPSRMRQTSAISNESRSDGTNDSLDVAHPIPDNPRQTPCVPTHRAQTFLFSMDATVAEIGRPRSDHRGGRR